MKVEDTNQHIIKNPAQTTVEKADNLAGKKKIEQKPNDNIATSKPAAIKSDTVELSAESLALANAAKADSSNDITETQKSVTPAPQSKTKREDTDGQINVGKKSETDKIENNNDKNVLAKLLKMANKKSGLFGLETDLFKTNEQKDKDNTPGKKLNFFM